MPKMTQTQKNEKRTVQGLPNSQKIILDVCCGGRMFWFDKKNPNAIFVDRRIVKTMMVGKGRNARKFACEPDVVMDFRNLKFADNTFNLVVFDPPHYTRAGEKSYMAQKYGVLEPTWQQDIKKGFSECFRVLKTNGVLIFKWSDYFIPLKKILKLTDVQPLFGHVSGKAQKTHWICFMKITNQ